VVPRVVEDRVPCLEELRVNGHLIATSMVSCFVGRWMSLVIRVVCRGRHIVGTT